MNEYPSQERPAETDPMASPGSHCIACREPIHARARLCPHCGSAQRPDRLATLGRALRWIGGATALLSLVLATAQLSTIYWSWRERQAAIADLVTAAQLQADAGDYAGAWRLLEEALRRDPGVRAARRLRGALAMSQVRGLDPTDGEALTRALDRLLPALYLGTVERDPTSRADALAHLGWANFLRFQHGVRGPEIEGFYRRAIGLEPSNAFAHAMWGHWLLWPDNPRSDGGQRVEEAFQHFESALAAGRARGDVRGLQLRALLSYERGTDARLAAVVVANEVRIEGGTIDAGVARRLLRVLRAAAAERGPEAEDLKRGLDADLPAAELLATYRWMLRDLVQSPDPTDLYALGELAERSGYDARALAFYRQSFEEALNLRSVKTLAATAIERLTGKSPN